MRHRVNLLDMWVDKIDFKSAVDQIESFIQDRTPHQVITANIDFLRLGHQDPSFRDLINAADLVVADGMPLLWGARLLGDTLPERVTGIELLTACARLSADKGYSMFLLGAGQGVAEQAAAVLRDRFPGINIVGTYAPPVGGFSPMEEESMVRCIQEMQPDMLFVAFGAPKQDRWIRRHLHRLDVPVCMGVGGSFDFLAGRVRRAPVWMQKCGLEWFFRLSQEPSRLWRRYLIDDLPIFARLMAQGRTHGTAVRPVTSLIATDPGSSVSRTERVEVRPAPDTSIHVA